jgi:hypothetical protein
MRMMTAGDSFGRQYDRRGRGAEVDHEGAAAAETKRFRQRRKQVVDGQLPDIPGRGRISLRSHGCFFRELGVPGR